MTKLISNTLQQAGFTATSVAVITVPPVEEYEYSFDDTDDYITFDAKVFDPANPQFELEGWFDLANYDGTLFSQNMSNSSSGREFQIYKISSGIKLVVGGSLRTLLTDPALLNQAGLWGFKLYGDAVDGFHIDVSFNGELLDTVNWSSVGSVTEANAMPMLAGRSAGAVGVAGSFHGGVIKNFKFWQGDKATGQLLIDLPLNEGAAASIENLAASGPNATAHNFNPERWTLIS